MSDTAAIVRAKRGVSLADINTKPKVLLCAALPLVLMLVVGAIALVNIEQMNRTQGLVDQRQQVMAETANIVAAAVDMETGMRGFLLAGDVQFLEPYERGQVGVFEGLAKLRQNLGENEPQVDRVMQAEQILRKWREDVAEPQIALRRAIGTAATMNDMADEVGKGAGKVYFDKFRSQIETFITREEALLVKRQAELNRVLNNGAATRAGMQDVLGWVAHTNKVIVIGKDILAAATDMETGMHGFLVSGDNNFLEPFNSGRAAFNEMSEALKETVSDNPAQVTLLGEIQGTIALWRANVVTPLLALRREIGTAETMDDMARLVGEARGKVFFDSFRDVMAEFSAIEKDLMTARRADNTATREMTMTAIPVAAALALLFGLGVAVVVGGSIGAAVRELTGLMKRLADGDQSITVTGQSRGDEIGEMARATEVFKQNAIHVTALNREQETASKELAELAAEREKAVLREIELARQKEEADKTATAEREAMMAELGQSFGSVLSAALRGQFSERVPAQFADHVLNELASNINELLSTVDHGISQTGKALERVANGDLTRHIEGDFQGSFGDLQSNTNNMMNELRALIADISDSSSTLAASSAELRDTSGTLSVQTENNAASLGQTSAALEEISASIKHVSSNVAHASTNARTARDTALSSEKIAADAATSMSSIAEASKEITRVIGVIDEIAFQINLLALNAGVEAARAGEAGRGFSVVATEVRQLAQRASDASKEIAVVIGKSDAAVSEGVERVSGAKSSLEAIAKSVIDITAGIDEISTAISEQAGGIGEITTALGEIDHSNQRQAASFEEVTAASTILASEADSLKKATTRFEIGQNAKTSARKAAPMIAAPVVQKTVVNGIVSQHAGATLDAGWDEF